jgi:hypothetical protein
LERCLDQAKSIEWHGCRLLGGWRGAIAGKPAPTVGPGMPARDWLAGRSSSRASQLPQFEWRVPARDWLAGRPSSRASPLPQFEWRVPARDWLAGRPSSLASQLLQGLSTSERNWAAGRPSSRASPLPQKSKGRSAHTHAPHHSSGRALARLQLLILIHPPPREAEWRCSSGDWRAAPFDAVELIACRSKRSRPEGNAPG